MKKKLYLQPTIIVAGKLSLRLMTASRGWSQDGNPPFTVEQEKGVTNDDLLPPPSQPDPWGEGYGGFLDLD